MEAVKSRHEYFMRAALQQAKQAYAQGEVPVGAVAVYEGEIIACGHNRQEGSCDPTAHAEVLTLRAAAALRGGWRLNGVTLYVTLEPCPMCAGAIVQARISRLVYGSPDPREGAVDSVINLVDNSRFKHRVEVIGGVLEDECRELLKQFFIQLRRDG